MVWSFLQGAANAFDFAVDDELRNTHAVSQYLRSSSAFGSIGRDAKVVTIDGLRIGRKKLKHHESEKEEKQRHFQE